MLNNIFEMENKRSVEKQESLPSCPGSNLDNNASSVLSSITHPSVRSRQYLKTIFEKINSGDNVLSRIPSRLDPNIQFSDDDESEDEDNRNKSPDTFEEIKLKKEVSEAAKTPTLPQLSCELFKADKYARVLPPNSNLKSSLYYSKNSAPILPVSKPLTFKHDVSNVRNLLPQSEIKLNKMHRHFSERGAKFNPLEQPDIKMRIPLAPRSESSCLSLAVNETNSLPVEVINVNGKSYSVLSLLGCGGSCKVYSVFDIENKTLVALKQVQLKNTDPSLREGYKKEIEYLKKLQSSNRVIKMYDYEYCENEIFLVLEHGDIDFAKYIHNEAKLKRLSPLMIKFYWGQMLEAVADIHKYGIIHSDLKPANFLLVAGNLKLIDFGIAASVPDDMTSTFRDTQVGTLNFISPEAITQLQPSNSKQMCFKVGVKSDVWSLGCILYYLVYNVPPFHNFKTLMQKVHAITNPSYEIPFPEIPDKLLLDVLKSCLKRNVKERASVEELLKHPYLNDDLRKPPEQSDALKNVLEQVQVFTPRRMSVLAKVVKELSEKTDI
ncbi:dual specificity protein kinase Ttk-like [Stegodyphus dumicola]|uniref:dual specificity protein kinase Ttk-like n=1 Tax=Stegodyphus dumicola TaxID=202533 RepID=UPI0015AB313D|nr:dual specificity protein kinase Ttk-like [Stegodyphus dumicola]